MLTKMPFTIIAILIISLQPLFADSIPEHAKKDAKKLIDLIKLYKEISKKHDSGFDNKVKDIERSYYLSLNRSIDKIPPPPPPKDLFETRYEYSKRIETYKKKLAIAKSRQKREADRISREYNLRHKISMAEIACLNNKIKALEPIVEQIRSIQNKKIKFPEEAPEVILLPPEADKFRFPVNIVRKGRAWTKYWDYTDRNKAREFWNSKSLLKAEVHAQLEVLSGYKIIAVPTIIFVKNRKTGENKEFAIKKVKPIPAITDLKDMREQELPAARLMAALSNVVKGPVQGMEFIYISPRTFVMGSPRDERGRWPNETQHKVTFTKGFYMMTTEVTQRQWRSIMGSNPSGFQKCGSDCPVENIYWGEVLIFIKRLNKMENTNAYRLPTEAEWEFACRAGNKHFGANDKSEEQLKNYAWYFDNSGGTPHPVGRKKPNRWGLFDMQGNVSEWCQDWAGAYPDNHVTDPKGPFSGKFRVARGGNWQFGRRSCRAADRNFNLPGDKSEAIGFRLVKTP